MEDWSVHTTKQWLEREGKLFLVAFCPRRNTGDWGRIILLITVLFLSGFSDIADILCGEHMIDGRVLMSMNEEDLLLPILNLKVFGDVRRLSSLLGNVR